MNGNEWRAREEICWCFREVFQSLAHFHLNTNSKIAQKAELWRSPWSTCTGYYVKVPDDLIKLSPFLNLARDFHANVLILKECAQNKSELWALYIRQNFNSSFCFAFCIHGARHMASTLVFFTALIFTSVPVMTAPTVFTSVVFAANC